MYASGQFSLSLLGKAVRTETGKTISRAYLHTILTNPFYMGNFIWGGPAAGIRHSIQIAV
jgi:recombinase